MTFQATTNQATNAPANDQTTKLSPSRVGTCGGLCLLIGLTLLYLPAILPFVAVSFVLRTLGFQTKSPR